jgi:hypothetical protein
MRSGEAHESNRGGTPGWRARGARCGRFGVSRTGDSATEFQDAVILAPFGEVELESLGG